MSNKENDKKFQSGRESFSDYMADQRYQDMAFVHKSLCYLCPSTDTEQFLGKINLCAPCRELLAIELLRFKCAKCGYEWRGRLGTRPDRCPDCGNKRWWKPKREVK